MRDFETGTEEIHLIFSKLTVLVAYPLADWKKAVLAALGLLGLAAFIIFVIRPGGFEGQVAWFIGLFPGALLLLPFADRIYKVSPMLDKVLYWPVLLTTSWVWYFILSFIAIKGYRLFTRTLGE